MICTLWCEFRSFTAVSLQWLQLAKDTNRELLSTVVAPGTCLPRMQIHRIPDLHRGRGQQLYQWNSCAETQHSPWYTALKTLPKVQPWKSIPTSPFTVKFRTRDCWIPLVQAPEERFWCFFCASERLHKGNYGPEFLNCHFPLYPKSCLFQLFYMEKEFWKMKTFIRGWFLPSAIS